MTKKKIVLGLLGVFVVAGALGVWQYPKLAYLRGMAQAKAHGRVAGAMLVRLDVPFYRQEHSLSCEIAALRMALAGVGYIVSESELINLLPFDPTAKGKGVWGDPYIGFVGSIDGKMPQSGYGVYWNPIALVGQNFTHTEVIENASPQDLTKHLLEGRPIVYWGFFGRGKTVSWHTPLGKQIDGVNGEHARTIIGFSGTPENPDGFLLLDPIYGDMFWTTEELFENSKPFNSSGVVVYKTF